MQKLLGLACLALVLQGCGANDSAQSAAQTPAPAASTAVSITSVTPAASTVAATETMYQTLQGEPLELSAYAGKKVFLNYWATWCAPCIREIPSIANAAAALQNENYVFLLASDEGLETINDFLLDREFKGNFIKLNGYFGGHGIDAVPSSVLYDETGAVINSWAGAAEWDSPEMLAQLRGE